MTTIFLNNITEVDFAYVENGILKGDSHRPQVLVTGQVTEGEEVVVDFSTIKKWVKSVIDNQGFDHKFVVNEDDFVIRPNFEFEKDSSNITLTEKSGNFTISLPKSRIIIIPKGYTYKDMYNQVLLKMNPFNVNIEVIGFDSKPNLPYKSDNEFQVTLPFNYVHGLPYSTSHGCKNIVHGHKSFVTLNYSDAVSVEEEKLITKLLHHLVSIYDSCYVLPQTTNRLKYTYTTDTSENFLIDLAHVDIVQLGCQPTIENMAKSLIDYCNDFINRQHPEVKPYLKSLYVSEGLSKGCYHGF